MIDKPQAPDRHKRTAFERDKYRCQFCGTSSGGLHVHHITSLSDGGTHDPRNLTTICPQCHRWIHALCDFHATTTDDVTAYNPSPLDLLIVLALGKHAPARTQTLAEQTYASTPSVTDRLYKLSALNIVEPTAAIHDTSTPTRWHFHGNIPSGDSPIGTLPENAKKAAMLTRDEMIRQRIENGESPDTIATELGLSRRTVYKSVDRAAALEPPVPNIHTHTSTETQAND